MSRVPFLSGTALACLASLALAGPLAADGAALVLSNTNYKELPDLGRASSLNRVARLLDRGDFSVASEDDAETRGLERAMAAFVGDIDDRTERLVVLLTGRFLHSQTDTYLLPVDADPADEGMVMARGLALSQVMAVLAGHPGASVLVLGVADPEIRAGRFLAPGLGMMDIPQGVTVISGEPADTARFAARDLVEPGRDLMRAAARYDLEVAGFAPSQLVVLPEPEDDVARAPVVLPREDSSAQDDQYWQKVVQTDTEAAYLEYLSTYPRGRHATEANNRIAEIRSEPFRDERLVEEALGLGRDARRAVQQNLTLLGFNTRGVDGIFGPGTRGAITGWQEQAGQRATGYLTAEQIARIEGQAARRAAELEEEARQRREAEERRDRAFWAETGSAGDAPGLTAYLERFPDGLYAEEAQERLQALEAAQRTRAAADDRRAWDAAVADGSSRAFETYVARNPMGAFVDQAKAEIARLNRPQGDEQLIARARAEEQSLGLNVAAMTLAEDRLKRMGFKPGLPDGKFNDKTRRALRRYQASRDLPVSGYLDQATLVRLLAESLN